MSAIGYRIRQSPLAAAALAIYGAALAVVGLWPDHVERGADRLIDVLLQVVPGLTYDALEFGSNILLFVPFGLIGALVVKRAPTALIGVSLMGLYVTAFIESVQQDMLPGRTGSTADVIANTLGAFLGCLVVVAIRETYYRITGRPRSWEVGHDRPRRDAVVPRHPERAAVLASSPSSGG